MYCMCFSKDRDKIRKDYPSLHIVSLYLIILYDTLYQMFVYGSFVLNMWFWFWVFFVHKEVNMLYNNLNNPGILCYFSDKPSSWMTVDTALFVMSAGETKEDSTLVCFTESKDKEVCLFQLKVL